MSRFNALERSACVALALLSVMFLAGCSTAGTVAEPVQTELTLAPTNSVSTGVQSRAVCIGLTRVDPRSYDGWDGACPGCDVDAKTLGRYFSSGGIPTTVLLNEACTLKNVKVVLASNAARLKAGDALIVATSGHGGQVPDKNGDEADSMDETVCLWDGQWVDDDIMAFLSARIPDGVYVVIITDNCHAEGNFRAFRRALRKTTQLVTLGKYGKQPVLRLRAGATEDVRILQFAGCREESYSYSIDAASGGTWTQTLLAHTQLTWGAWYAAAAANMPARQQPVLVKNGLVHSLLQSSIFPSAKRK